MLLQTSLTFLRKHKTQIIPAFRGVLTALHYKQFKENITDQWIKADLFPKSNLKNKKDSWSKESLKFACSRPAFCFYNFWDIAQWHPVFELAGQHSVG